MPGLQRQSQRNAGRTWERKNLLRTLTAFFFDAESNRQESNPGLEAPRLRDQLAADLLDGLMNFSLFCCAGNAANCCRTGGEDQIPGPSPDSEGKAVVGCCEVGPDALIELWIQALKRCRHPVAPLGFSADQGSSSLCFLAQLNSLTFELLAQFQGGANGQVTGLGVQVGHRLEVHGLWNAQAMDQLREGVLGAIFERWRWGDRAA